MRILALLTLLAVLSGAEEAMIYVPGDVYKYQTRPQESSSTFTVLCVDANNGKQVVSISVDGLSIKSKTAKDGVATTISHLPISADSLAQSNLKKVGHVDSLPDFKEGYKIWKDAFDAKRAGYWKVPLSEAIESMEVVLNK